MELLREGRRAVEETDAQETLRTYHNVGRVLDQYLLGEKDRAAYGEQTVVGLAKDVGLSKNTLYRAQGFSVYTQYSQMRETWVGVTI